MIKVYFLENREHRIICLKNTTITRVVVVVNYKMYVMS